MKFLILSIFLFLRFSSTTAVPLAPLYEAGGGYDEDLASRLIYFAAASFVGPTDKNADDLTQQCFTQAFPQGKWTRTTYNLNCQTDYPKDVCQGLFAVNSDLKMLVLAFRGTVGSAQLGNEMKDIMKDFVPFNDVQGNQIGTAYKYFYEAMDSMWGMVNSTISDPQYKGYTFYFTGHSLGGAIAALSALRARVNNMIPDQQIQLYTFGEPRVGNSYLAGNFRGRISSMYRVVHWRDPVPHMPFCKDSHNDDIPCVQNQDSAFHHPQEIWYNNSNQKMDVGIHDYVECDYGIGEDGSCSDGISDWQFLLDNFDKKGADLHNHYFNHRLDQWGPDGCSSSTIVKISASMLLLSVLAKFIF